MCLNKWESNLWDFCNCYVLILRNIFPFDAEIIFSHNFSEELFLVSCWGRVSGEQFQEAPADTLKVHVVVKIEVILYMGQENVLSLLVRFGAVAYY